MKKTIILMLVLILLVPTLTIAQEADDTEAIEAEINALALQLHSLDTRDPAATTWIGGNIGIDDLRADVVAGTQLEHMRLVDLAGTEVDLLEHETPLIVNFWASWCGPCVHEFPFALDYAENHLENAELIFVNVSDTSENAQRFLDTLDLGDIPSYRDVDNVYVDANIGLSAPPTTLLIDADGTVLVAHSGSLMPALMRFMDLVAGYPELGSFDAEMAGEPSEIANLEGVDLTEAATLMFDEPVSNEFDLTNWYVVYTYTATEGEHVDIIMVGLNRDENPYFDPYFIILNEDGERIAEQNDGRQPPDAHLDFIFPADGTYYIVATRLLEANSIFGGVYGFIVTDGESVP